MPTHFTVTVLPWLSILLLAACGPEKGEGDSSSSSGDASTGTTAASSDSAPTGTTTGAIDPTTGTDTGTTGTTGEPGQPLFCNGESPATPACLEDCVRDLSPETPVIDANCRALETRADMTSVAVPPCIEVMDSWQPPAGAEVCFALRIDPDGKQTFSKIDDMSAECVDAGVNAEVVLIRSAPPLPGACVFVTCELSENVPRDCPNL